MYKYINPLLHFLVFSKFYFVSTGVYGGSNNSASEDDRFDNFSEVSPLHTTDQPISASQSNDPSPSDFGTSTDSDDEEIPEHILQFSSPGTLIAHKEKCDSFLLSLTFS